MPPYTPARPVAVSFASPPDARFDWIDPSRSIKRRGILNKVDLFRSAPCPGQESLDVLTAPQLRRPGRVHRRAPWMAKATSRWTNGARTSCVNRRERGDRGHPARTRRGAHRPRETRFFATRGFPSSRRPWRHQSVRPRFPHTWALVLPPVRPGLAPLPAGSRR